MAGVLDALGKQVKIVNGHPTPPGLAFLDPAQRISVLGEDIQSDEIDADCLIVLDTSAWAQLGPMADVVRRFNGTKLVIDHHVGEDDLGAEFHKDTMRRGHRPFGGELRTAHGCEDNQAHGQRVVCSYCNRYGLVSICIDHRIHLSHHRRTDGCGEQFLPPSMATFTNATR